MCGAVSVKYDEHLDAELSRCFTAKEIEAFKQKGEIIFAYWDKRPLLPIKQEGRIKFIDWGNRDGKLALPKTGWAKLETLLLKKWDYLKPQVVLIPAQKGKEKKVWFELTANIKAILINKDGMERVYMITEEASQEYKELTRHDRMPRLHSLKDTKE